MLKRTKDGGFSLRSESNVAEALARREEIEADIEQIEKEIAATELGQELVELREEDEALSAAINGYVLDHYEAGEGFEDANWKATKVVSHRRVWNADKLMKLVPRGIWKNLVTVQVVPAKVDAFVREGKISLDAISAAYEETPNQPYIRITRKSEEVGTDEADELAAKLA